MICNCGAYLAQSDGKYFHPHSEDHEGAGPIKIADAETVEAAFRWWIISYKDKELAAYHIHRIMHETNAKELLEKESFLFWRRISTGKSDYFVDVSRDLVVRINRDVPLVPANQKIWQMLSKQINGVEIFLLLGYGLYISYLMRVDPVGLWITNTTQIGYTIIAVLCVYALSLGAQFLIDAIFGRKHTTYLMRANGPGYHVAQEKIKYNGNYSLSSNDLDKLGITAKHLKKDIMLINKQGMEPSTLNDLYRWGEDSPSKKGKAIPGDKPEKTGDGDSVKSNHSLP